MERRVGRVVVFLFVHFLPSGGNESCAGGGEIYEYKCDASKRIFRVKWKA